MDEAQYPSALNSPVSNQSVEISSSVPLESAADKEKEIETLTSLLGDLEKKASASRLYDSVAWWFVILGAFRPLTVIF